MEKGAPVYVVQTKEGGEQRKAIDLMALKQFLENQRQSFSVLNINPDNIDDEAKLQPQIASAAMSTLMQLEDVIDTHLGLKSKESGEAGAGEESGESESGETGEEPEESSEGPAEPAPEATDQPQSGEQNAEADESNDHIVL